ARERGLSRDAAPASRWEWRAPSGLLLHQIERRMQARLLAEVRTAKGDRVLAGLARQLIDERLDRKHIVVGTDAAPEPRVDPRRLLAVELHAKVGDVVRNVLRRIDTVPIDALLKGGWQPAR